MAKKKYVVKKYDGDDAYSYAIFKREDVKGLGNIICWGYAHPIQSGLSRGDATYFCNKRNSVVV